MKRESEMSQAMPSSVGTTPTRADTVETTIDRSAAAASKGPRLQRLRASLFILEAMNEIENVQAYAAIEAEGDSFVATSTARESTAYSEENKNYQDDAAFSFVSPSVINTMVMFADSYLRWRCSAQLRFGFYTTAVVAKEKNAGRAKEMGLALPSEPIIALLRKRDYAKPGLLPCIKSLVIDEYTRQYSKHASQGHLAILRDWDDAEWTRFLNRITWKLDAPNHAELDRQIVDAIKSCRLYCPAHHGKEHLIAAAIADLFDRRQGAPEFSDRFVHGADVALLFCEAERTEVPRTDPTWQSWKALPPPTDTRNIEDKLRAVCPTLRRPVLEIFQRKTAAGFIEFREHEQDKSVLAMRYQIYDACQDALLSLARRATTLGDNELMAEVDTLVAAAMRRVADRASEYDYRFRSESFVRGVVLSLLDGCFIDLDMDSP